MSPLTDGLTVATGTADMDMGDAAAPYNGLGPCNGLTGDGLAPCIAVAGIGTKPARGGGPATGRGKAVTGDCSWNIPPGLGRSGVTPSGRVNLFQHQQRCVFRLPVKHDDLQDG
jgi:hypothetical protein